MTPVYVDPVFGTLTPGEAGVWAEGTVEQVAGVAAGTEGFATLADAYAACDAGGAVYLAPGVYAPADLTKSLAVVGTARDRCTITVPASGPTTFTIAAGTEVRFRRVGVEATAATQYACVRVTAGAKAAFVDCQFRRPVVSVLADQGGAAVCVGCDGVAPEAGAGGAVGSYPAPRLPATAAAPARDTGQYRTPMTLLAAARYKVETGESRRVWVPVTSFWGRHDPVRSYEGAVGRVEVQGSTAMVYTRVGLPATQDMRVRWRGVDLDVVGVEAVDQRTGEMMIGVVETTPGGD